MQYYNSWLIRLGGGRSKIIKYCVLLSNYAKQVPNAAPYAVPPLLVVRL